MKTVSILIVLSGLLLTACEPRMAIRLKSNDEMVLPAPTTEVTLAEDTEGLTPVILPSEEPEAEEPPEEEQEEVAPPPPPPPPPPTIEEQIESLTAPIYFRLDEYGLNAEAIEQLKSLAAFVNQDAQRDLMIRIEGHCDDRGTREYNFALGAARANAISKRLVRFGVNKNRISTISYGKEKPAFTGTSKLARARNRRGDIFLRTPQP